MAWVVLANRPVGSLLTSAFVNQVVGDIADLDSRGRPSSDVLATLETTTSTTYTDLATVNRPAVALVTGTAAIVVMSAYITGSSVGNGNFMAFAVSGATTIAASDSTSLEFQASTGGAQQCSAVFPITNLTAGANTFTAKYRVVAGTGTFQNRNLTVWPANNLS